MSNFTYVSTDTDMLPAEASGRLEVAPGTHTGWQGTKIPGATMT